MKALTLTQPWATLIAREAKRWETRSWRTHHRGPLAIHAAKDFPSYARDLCKVEPFASELRPIAGLPSELPLGALVAIVEVRGCLRTEDALARYVIEGTPEESFGDWSRGRWAWRLGILWTFAEPIPWSGAQGLWDVPDEVVEHGRPTPVPATPETTERDPQGWLELDPEERDPDGPVLGRCPHDVDLDRAFCPHGCRV